MDAAAATACAAIVAVMLAGCGGSGREPADATPPGNAAAPVLAAGARYPLENRDTCVVVSGGGVPASDVQLGLPREAPGTRGLVIAATPAGAESARILVAAVLDTPDRRPGQPQERFAVTVPPTARVVQRVGHRAAPGTLAVCHAVTVWFEGPVLESYPGQATASAVVIERVLEHVRAPR